ncbi:MAG: hypothetical protein MJ250_08980 [Alphaproteobacteria bacterium]|nr:hypothetical protein [Alphaproteobacteria bacterium]
MRYILFSLILFLTACGHTGLKHDNFISSVKKGDYQTAEQIASDDDFYQDEPSLLLRAMELGSFHFIKGEFYQALQQFDKAKQISDDLYTTRVSKKVSSNVLGDGLDNYDGKRFERSLIRFYQSLTNYMLYQQGFYESFVENEKTIPQVDLDESQKRKHLSAARANIKEWDAFLKSLRYDTTDKAEFSFDMLAKTWGAKVHKNYGTSTDDQIARILYFDALKISQGPYAKYPSFSSTEKFVDYVKKEQSNIRDEQQYNVHLLLNSGTIAEKTAGKYDFRLPFVGMSGKAGCARIFQGQNIAYEFPEMKQPKTPDPYKYEIKKENRIVSKGDFVLTEPLSEIAYEEYDRTKAGLIAKKTARLISKYTAAVVSACSAYNSGNQDPWQELAIWAAFKVATIGIEKTEYADLRYWGLLPNAIYQQSVRLPKGKYTLEVYQNENLVKTMPFEVQRGKKQVVVVHHF